MRWLELSPGYACNCRCTGCYSCSADPRHQMSWLEVLDWLQRARRQGARYLWLSGGEPTLRKDFLQTLRAARHLGFERIKVQTNGLMFAYPEFARRAVDAGMTEVNVLLKSRDPAVNDELNGLPGAFELQAKAIACLRELPLRLEGDFLMTQRNYAELPAVVEYYAAQGFRHFNLSLFSVIDQGDQDLRALVPRLSDCLAPMLAALDVARGHGATLCSQNSPHCALPPQAWEMLFDAPGMDLVVVNPGGHAFALEESLLEQGQFTEDCEQCTVRHQCRGLRSDYVDVHGTGELRPLTAAEVRGFDPRGSVLDIAPKRSSRNRVGP